MGFNLLKLPWTFLGVYKPFAQNKVIETISNILNKYVLKYQNIPIAGDFNMYVLLNAVWGNCPQSGTEVGTH